MIELVALAPPEGAAPAAGAPAAARLREVNPHVNVELHGVLDLGFAILDLPTGRGIGKAFSRRVR